MSLWDEARAALDGLPQGGGLNIAYECVDRHLVHGRGGQPAFRFVGTDDGVRAMTYAELALLTGRFASVLRTLGVARGEAVVTLLGRTAELSIAALGTLRAGAVFSALFSSFGPDPVRVRLHAARARVLVTTAAAYRRKIAPQRSRLPDLEHVLLIDGEEAGTLDYRRLMAAAPGDTAIDATDPAGPALLHFTSGTTGRPKGALHVHEAVVAHTATARLALDLGPGDIYWCTADPGWVTGISYGLIAPLACGATALVDAGPFDAGRWYRLLAEHRVAVWYTAPTAVRMLMRAGPDLARGRDLSALRHIASVGEPLDPEAVHWGERALGHPIHDTWWQTETGAIMIANLPGSAPVAGAMGVPLPDIEAAVVRRREGGGLDILTSPDASGELALRAGWPSMFRGYLGDEARYRACFADGYYLSGDLVRRDANGRFWFIGRGDDVIKTAGHLVGPFEIESVLLEHPAVAEAGVIGTPDPVVGETIAAFVSLMPGHAADDGLKRALLAHVRARLGPAIAPREIAFAADLPKTRSGKIMRRVLKARALGLPEGDLSTLEGGEDGVDSGASTD